MGLRGPRFVRRPRRTTSMGTTQSSGRSSTARTWCALVERTHEHVAEFVHAQIEHMGVGSPALCALQMPLRMLDLILPVAMKPLQQIQRCRAAVRASVADPLIGWRRSSADQLPVFA